MTLRKMYLHCGPLKTGSTAIQSFVRAAAEAGLLRSIDYPLIDKKLSVDGIESGNASSVSHFLRFDFEPKNGVQKLTDLLLKIVQNCQHSDRPVLLSSEGFWALDKEGAFLLTQELTRMGFALEVVFVVRPFQDVWRSQISQAVRGGLFTEFDSVQGSTNYLEKLKIWSDLQLPMHVIPYDAENVVAPFLDFLGESDLKQVDLGVERVNSKLSRAEAQILRATFRPDRGKQLTNQISNLLRDFYKQSDALERKALEDDILEQLNLTMDVPDEWQPVHGYLELEAGMKEITNPLNQAFWDLLMVGSDAPMTYSFENTPALAAIQENPKLTEFQLRLLNKSVMSALIQTQNHASNLEALLVSGTSSSVLVNGIDGKLTFKDNSRLARSRIGFDPIHYLMLNPDVDFAGADAQEHYETFGKFEGRYTKIEIKTSTESSQLWKRPLLLVHNPRTGGTTFREMLTEEFGEVRVTRNHSEVAIGPEDSYSDCSFLLADDFNPLQQGKVVLVGHFPAEIKNAVNFEHSSAIFLRNPVTRSLSILRKEARDLSRTPEEMLADAEFVNKHIKNAQCRILSAPISDGFDSGVFEVTPEHLDQAKQQLSEFDFIGLQENYVESIKMFDWQFTTNLKSRLEILNESSEVAIDGDVSELLHPLLKYDLELYEYAQILFDARLNKFRRNGS